LSVDSGDKKSTMRITKDTPGAHSFQIRGQILSIGQGFKGLKVFTMGPNANFFVRTLSGVLGRLVGEGVNSTLIGKKVDVELISFELKGAGSQADAFIEFVLIKKEPQTTPDAAQRISLPPSQPVRITETALAAARRVNREINRHGLDAERRGEAEWAVLMAVRELERFGMEVKIGWTRELVADFSQMRELAECVDKLRRRLGAEPLAYKLPDIGKIKDFEQLPQHRPPRECEPEDLVQKPTANHFAQKDLAFLLQHCADLRQLAEIGKAAGWNYGRISAGRELVRWLDYLLWDPTVNLKKEFAALADWPAPLLDEFVKYLTAVRDQVNRALSPD
jgi:hypothetical protein